MMNTAEEVNVLARIVMIFKMTDMAATAAMVLLLENESGDKVAVEEDTTVMTVVEDGEAVGPGAIMAVEVEVLLSAVAIEAVAVVVTVEEEEATMVGEEVVMVEEVDIEPSLLSLIVLYRAMDGFTILKQQIRLKRTISLSLMIPISIELIYKPKAKNGSS